MSRVGGTIQARRCMGAMSSLGGVLDRTLYNSEHCNNIAAMFYAIWDAFVQVSRSRTALYLTGVKVSCTVDQSPVQRTLFRGSTYKSRNMVQWHNRIILLFMNQKYEIS